MIVMEIKFLLNFFLNSRGLDFKYISQKTKISNLRLSFLIKKR